MPGRIALHQPDAGRRELGTHRRVHTRIRTGDTVTELTRQQGDAAHERAADPQDVDMPFQPTPGRAKRA